MISFNDMVHVGEDDIFSCFNTFCDIFTCDILFIKDIAPQLWYLTIMEECRSIISDIITSNGYKDVYAFADSSGTIPLLNITKQLSQFRHAIIINGQPTLKEAVVNNYKDCSDCVVFDPSLITGLNAEYMSPLENVSENVLSKYVFYINNSISDYSNYKYLITVYPQHLQSKHICFEETNESHIDYIKRKLTDRYFLSILAQLVPPPAPLRRRRVRDGGRTGERTQRLVGRL